MRVFHLEPFLKKTESHFVEVALAMDSHFKKTLGTFHLVGNKSLEDSVRQLFPNVVAGISQTCFEDPQNKGVSFAEDLFQLHKQFQLQGDDLLIVSTSYENQILGAAIYQRETSCPPFMALHFHQLFPPSRDSDDVANPLFRKLWRRRLRKAFSKERSSKVSYWTTESVRLNKDYVRVSQQAVGMLPVPFLSGGETGWGLPNTNNDGTFRIGYLGDGRQEKGLLVWLKLIRALEESSLPYRFVVQVNNPRGFSDEQRSELESLIHRVKDNPKVQIIRDTLPPIEFHGLLQSLDLLAIPYNPLNYCRRVSGLAMHAAVYEKPVLASSGTWADVAVRSGQLAGRIFEYNKLNEALTIQNAIAGLETAIVQRHTLKTAAVAAARYFRSRNTAAEYLNRIFHSLLTQRRVT